MLWVYTSFPGAKDHFVKHHDLPLLDWSDSTPAELVTQSETAVQHHDKMAVFLGYLDGWMLSGTDEIRIRPLLRKFSVAVVTRYPMALPLAWKNETEILYTDLQHHGESHPDHDGCSDSHTVSHEHGPVASRPADPVSTPQGGKAGRSAPRRKRTGPNPPSNQGGGKEAHGVRA